MMLRLLVERRRKNHRLRVALHVRHFLWALVDEKHDEHRLGMVRGDGVCDLLQENRLADARRSHDEPALAEPDRREDVHDARRVFAGARLKHDAPGRERRKEVFEVDDARGLARELAVHLQHAAETEVAVAVARVAKRPLHRVAGTEHVPADLLLGHKDVLRA